MIRELVAGLAIGLALGCDDAGTSSASSTSCADACSIAASHCVELLCSDGGCAAKLDCSGDCHAVGDLCRESC